MPRRIFATETRHDRVNPNDLGLQNHYPPPAAKLPLRFHSRDSPVSSFQVPSVLNRRRDQPEKDTGCYKTHPSK